MRRIALVPLVVLAILGASAEPPWLRPPKSWVPVPVPPASQGLHFLTMWQTPQSSWSRQSISLAVETFDGSLEAYVRATKRRLYAEPFRPSAYADVPYRCASGPAHLLVYDTAAFGSPRHFEQIAIKRGADVYVATYTRASDEPQSAAAASALRSTCR